MPFNSLFPVFFVAMLLSQETAQRSNFILLIQVKLFTWSLCSSQKTTKVFSVAVIIKNSVSSFLYCDRKIEGCNFFFFF